MPGMIFSPSMMFAPTLSYRIGNKGPRLRFKSLDIVTEDHILVVIGERYEYEAVLRLKTYACQTNRARILISICCNGFNVEEVFGEDMLRSVVGHDFDSTP